ncbi:histone-arginine methyltransferase CARM1 isoform X1 [Athene noctua]
MSVVFFFFSHFQSVWCFPASFLAGLFLIPLQKYGRWEEGRWPRAACCRHRDTAGFAPPPPLTGGVIYRIKEDLGARVPFAGSAAPSLIPFFPAVPGSGRVPWERRGGENAAGSAHTGPYRSFRGGSQLAESLPSPQPVHGGAAPVPPLWVLPLGNPTLGIPPCRRGQAGDPRAPAGMGPQCRCFAVPSPNPSQIVLDVGCGSGILSFFAAQAGARKIYAVEASTMAQHAEVLVKSNNLTERIVVIPGKVEEVSLPEQVDIIISEPMGYMLFNERMLESYLHAKKYLKPSGNMFPTIGDVHLAPFTDEQLYMEQFTKANFWYQPSFHGVDLSALRGAAVDEYFRQPVVDTFDIRILMAKSVKYTVNFLEAKEGDLHRIEIPFKFHMLHSGLVHGLAFWFDVAFIGSIMTVWLSTAPTEPLTHWYQVRCLFQSPLFAKAGDTLSGTCLLIANKRQSYDISIVAQVDQTGSKSSNLLDLKNPFFRYTGTTPSPPPGSHYTSPSENMWNTGSTYNMSTGMAVAGMPAAYDLSSVIAGGSNVGHNNLIPLANTGIVNHTHSRMGSIMSTGIVQGSSSAQSGGGSSTHYPLNSQFTMGGPAISMASPMSITTNTMHYGS